MATFGYKATLTCDCGTANAFVALGSYCVIKWDGIKVKVEPVLPLDQITPTKLPGSVDYGFVTVEVYYVKADYTQAFGLLRATHNFLQTAPEATTGSQTWAFSGTIEDLSGPEWIHDQLAKVTLKIAVSGVPTLGAVS